MSDQRALLLTDVVDSTRLAERLGDAAMADVWTAHDRVARDLLPPWRGREIDKTDGMLLLFEQAADAVHYALAYQRALAALPVPLSARAGLHVGPVILRENSAADIARGAKPLEVDGIAKPTAARVMAVAQGGQLLLTPEAREALGESTLPLASLGHWLMKGLAEPIELFEVAASEADFSLPADGDKAYRVVRHGEHWRPLREVPNNLPQQVTSFIGRESELREVRARLAEARLLTLFGMGGLGKTRLSLQVAESMLAEFPDGVWFLDLAPIRDPALVASEAAQVLDVREEPGRLLVQTLCAALKASRALLVFDNCEHLVQACADLANAILRAAPRVRILASSREALRVPGEQIYPVLPLPLPAREDGLDALSRSTAVRLFVERAQLHKPAFTLGEREAPAVAELVMRLEGIPLALELAAARVRTLSVADINARLKDRYKILTGGGRVLLPRQQTLRALVDWSYDLLNEPEQIVFNRLSVFAGGFDLAAAEAVCGAEPVAQEEVLNLVASLVDKSLVLMDERDEGTRYRMLATIGEYAQERLESAGDGGATAARHCDHYFIVAKAVRDGLKGPEQAEWIARAEIDLDNLRASIALALAGGVDAFVAVKFAIAMLTFWMLRGYSTEGRSVVHAALALPAVQASDMAQAHATYVGAALAESQGDHAEARVMLEACLELRRRMGKPVEIAATLSTLALAHLQGGDAAAARGCESEALGLFRSLGEKLGEAVSLVHLGQIAVFVGDDAQARGVLTECLFIARQVMNREIEGEAELTLGRCLFEGGQVDEARQHLARSLEICREASDRRGEAHALWLLGRLALEADDLAESQPLLGGALLTFRDFEMREALVECLEDHAMLALKSGKPVSAVRIASAAQEYRRRLDLVRSANGDRRWNARRAALVARLPELAFKQAWEAGSQMDLPQAIGEARDLSAAPAVAA